MRLLGEYRQSNAEVQGSDRQIFCKQNNYMRVNLNQIKQTLFIAYKLRPIEHICRDQSRDLSCVYVFAYEQGVYRQSVPSARI